MPAPLAIEPLTPLGVAAILSIYTKSIETVNEAADKQWRFVTTTIYAKAIEAIDEAVDKNRKAMERCTNGKRG